MKEALTKLRSKNLSIFDLPAELRIRIYEYALLTPTGYCCLCDKHLNHRPEKESLHQDLYHQYPNTALLQANKQIYHEAKDVIYNGTVFVGELRDFWNQMAMIKPPLRHKVRHVFLCEVFADMEDISSSNWSVIDLDFPKVKHLRISASRRIPLTPAGAPILSSAREVRCFKHSNLDRVIAGLPEDCETSFNPSCEHERAILEHMAASLNEEYPDHADGQLVFVPIEKVDDGGKRAQWVRKQLEDYCNRFRMPVPMLIR